MTATRDPRGVLLDLLARHAYRYDPAGFLLASGVTSNEYLDCKQALSQPDALVALGTLVLATLGAEPVAVGGLTMGADPVAISAACASAGTARPVRWFSVRKDRKGHGRTRMIEGAVVAGDAVAVVDDVVTSGSSTIDAVTKCRDEGLQVRQVIVLVDREHGGLDAIRQLVGPTVPVVALFTKQEVRTRWEAAQAINGSPARA